MLKRWVTGLLFIPAVLDAQALVNMPGTEGPSAGFVLESWTVKDGLPVNSINKVIQTKSGYIWLATFDGLVRFDGVRFTTFNTGNSEGLPSSRIIDLKEEPGGAIVLTTEGMQMVRFKDGKFSLIGRSSATGSRESILTARASDGRTWRATRDAVYLDSQVAYRRPAKTGQALTITSITPDHEGSLWFGTISGGLFQLKPAVFMMYGLSAEPSSNNLYSVTPSRSGGVWAGSWGAGAVSHIDGTHVTTYGPAQKMYFLAASLHEDASGRLWIGDVPCKLPAMQCGSRPVGPRFNVHASYEDNTKFLFGSETGVFELRDNKFEHLEGSPRAIVRAFVRTKDSALWMATNGAGVVQLKNGAYTSITTREGLPSDLIRALYEDADGWLWIGTEGKGLVRINPREWTASGARGKIVNIRSRDGLFDDGIHTILEDNAGRMWMSTNRGIFWVERSELDAFAEKKIQRVRSTGYTERHGLRNREANGGNQPAATKTADGRLWFATQDGLAMVDPSRIALNATPPNVVIEQVEAGGSPLGNHSATLEIPPDKRDIRIEYTGLSFLAPENVRFRYRLIPYDRTWVDADTRRTATYTRVPPGSYTFEVIASAGGDKWSPRGASLNLEVAPRFIETTTFKLIGLLAIALLIWGGVRYRLARLRQVARDLQARVDERTRELREREAQLAEQNARLESQADQLQELDRAKTRFFANVSHELRTPLTLTIGPLEDARSQLAGNGSHGAVSRIDMALRNARRLFRLVNQILDVSRLEAGGTRLHARPGDLTGFVRGIASAFSAVAERKGITFRVDAPGDSVEVWFDPDAFEKVIANLLSNAFKFTPERGGILVSIGTSENVARVKVSDSGPGIPSEHVAHIFDRFYQVDETNTRAQPGTGIGLSLARELAELHGGTIEVESGPGGGATFTLSLPLGREHLSQDQIDVSGAQSLADAPDAVLASIAVTDEHASAIPRPRGIPDDSPTLLVVDDHADLRTYVRSRFESRYRIVEAADGADAIRRAREVIPDLVISDVMMPGTDGHAMCAALRESPETDFIPVILLTALAGQDEKIAGLGRGADDYIVKPFDMRELEARVENLIASRRRLRERFSGKQVSLHGSSEMSESDKAFVERLKAAIEASISNPDFGVGELAQAVFHDRSHLFRRTREVLGETPSDLLRRLRLERAAALLYESDGTIAEVAYGAGFNSVSNFCRVFRALYGVTPSEYRERNATHTNSQPAR